ncbi:MAG: HEPN domain-containing protein [Candidatus Thermoplasmatota archaeon]
MVKELRTRPVERGLYRNYLKKAEEFHETAVENYEKERWNACVVNAIHCAISCCDALTVFYLGFRYAGERHEDAAELLKQTDIAKNELNDKLKHFYALISIKNRAEYEERLMFKVDAERAKKACERFLSWTKGKIGVG